MARHSTRRSRAPDHAGRRGRRRPVDRARHWRQLDHLSLLNGLLLRTLPVKDPARLALLTDSSPDHVRVWSYPVWRQIQQRPELFEQSAAWSFTRFNLASGGETQLIDGMWASGSFFDTLGVTALLGRTLTDLDDRRGSADGSVAVISYSFWQGRFAGAADIVGRPLTIDAVPFTIVGVMPRDFAGPELGRAFDACRNTGGSAARASRHAHRSGGRPARKPTTAGR